MLVRRLARPMLSAVFIVQGIDSLLNTPRASEAVRPTLEGLQKLPDPVGPRIPDNAKVVARVNGAIQVAAAMCLATGRMPRVAAATLAVTVIPANLGDHMFWDEPDPAEKARKRRDFATDVSLVGALILASADTAGKPSLGWRGKRAGRRAIEAVSSALPVGDGSSESQLAEKISRHLHSGAERGQELASAAIEKGAPIAHSVRRRGTELAHNVSERLVDLERTLG